MIRADYLVVCILSVATASAPTTTTTTTPPPATTGSHLGDALVQANAKGFPPELLYGVAGLDGTGRSAGDDKARLAAALESPDVRQAARKAAVEYAVKDLAATGRDDTEGYCSYSWLRWLPFMNCDEPATSESRQPLQLVNSNRNCMR